MHLQGLCPLAAQVCRKERFGRCVAVDQGRVIADRMCQNVRDWAEDREGVLPEQEGCAISESQFECDTQCRETYGLGLLSTPLWCRG